MAKKKAKRNPAKKGKAQGRKIKAKSKRPDRGLNPGLKKSKFSRIKQEYFDQDYIDKLSDKDKAWLSKFNDEYLGANLKDGGNKFHKTKRLKKDCFDRNNARNRDIYGDAKAGGRLELAGERVLGDGEVNYENELIDYIDSKNKDQ